MSEESYTVNQVLDRYWQDCKHTLAPRTQKDYPRHIKIIRAHFGEKVARDLVPKDFAPFMQVTKGRIHRNRTAAVMSAAFSHAVRYLFWLDRNVLRDVARHRSQPRDRYVTDAEFNAYVEWVPMVRIKLAMQLALLTGQRQGDLLALRWTDVKDGAIHFKQAKTGKRLALELTGELKRVLGKCAQLEPHCEFVIGNEEGQKYTSEGFKSNWQRFMARWVELGNIRFTFHDLRGKSASDSPTIEAAYERLGHTSMAMTRRVYDRGIRRVQPLR